MNKGRGLSNMPVEDLRKEMEAMLLMIGFGQCESNDMIKSFYEPNEHYPLPKKSKIKPKRIVKSYFPKEQPQMKY
jgi:hypothetical protein